MTALRKITRLIRHRRRVQPLFYGIAGLLLALTVVGVLALSSVRDRAQAEPESSSIDDASRDEPQQPQAEAAYRTLSSRVGWTTAEFVIANTGTEDWQRCLFEVDASDFGDGFQYRHERLGVGQRLTVRATAFVRADGERYSLATRTPVRFTIRCLDVAGKPGVSIKASVSN